MSVEFSVADIPPMTDDSDPTYTAPSSDLTCEVCQTPLTYAGRGRKPRFCEDHRKGGSKASGAAAGPRASNADVAAAMAALDGVHTSLAFALMLLAPNAAQVWSAQIPSLEERNRGILTADRDLAKRISKWASKGSGGMLFLSYGVALAPVGAVAASERSAKRAEREAANAQVIDVDFPAAEQF